MTTDHYLGYLWANTYFLSQFRRRRYHNELSLDGAVTDPNFYEETNYDILPNNCELIQTYGIQRIDLTHFCEGFKQAFQERIEWLTPEVIDEYPDLLDQCLKLLGLRE